MAAHDIGGHSLYPVFRFPSKKDYDELPLESLQSMQQKFKSIYYIIVDEESMASPRPMSWI